MDARKYISIKLIRWFNSKIINNIISINDNKFKFYNWIAKMSQFSEVGFFPYNINDQGDLVILFQRNLKGPSPELFSDFGWHINKFEPSIYFSAVRGFLTKSFGLFSAQNDPGSEAIEISHVINKNTITIEGSNFLVPFFEDIEEPNFNEDNLYLCYLSSLHELLYYTKYLVIHYICDEYLGIFYPLPSYTNVDVINKIMAESKGYTKIEFSWVKLEDFILEWVSNSDDLDPQFVRPSKLVSSFDYSVIWSNASKLLDIQLRALPQVEEEYDDELYQLRPLPNYGIILLEPKEYWVGLYEAMIFPWLLDNGDYWEFYHGFEGEFPSTEELNSLKGIVIVDGSGINIIEQNNIIEGCRIFVDYLLNEINPNREKQGILF